MGIFPATDSDRGAIWAILEPMIRSGETYTLPRDLSKQKALDYWFDAEEIFVCKENDEVLGAYFLKRASRAGALIVNCGYVTAPAAQGRGIAGRCACIHWTEPGNAASAPCNSTSSLAPTSVPSNYGPI